MCVGGGGGGGGGGVLMYVSAVHHYGSCVKHKDISERVNALIMESIVFQA